MRVLVVCVGLAVASCSVTTSEEKKPEAKPAPAAVGGGCKADADCTSGTCLADEAHPGGYCTVLDCDTTTCPSGSTCMIDRDGSRACLQGCADGSECRPGYACTDNGVCVKSCTADSCGDGFTCEEETSICVADATKHPGPFPAPACDDLPLRDCKDGQACNTLEPFEPVKGPGYDNYPLNGEKETDQYRSFARRDLQMLVKWATAYVDCKGKSWRFGNHQPLGLGDMSEKDGSIPGTRENDPGHPKGTHVNGFDMDIAYYQLKARDNRLREVCEHWNDAGDQYHCVKEPNDLDVWRTALVLGAAVTSDRVRVIGVDGKIGPLVHEKMKILCAEGWLPKAACDNKGAITFEVTNANRGWYYFHHHHWHISLNPPGVFDAPPRGVLSPVVGDHRELSAIVGHSHSR